jgi:hypothetical protein
MSNQRERSQTSSKRRRQCERLAVALLHEPSLEQAAAAAGISVSTAYRMRREPEFEEEFRQARRQVVSEASAHLQAACTEAVSTMLAIMRDSKASASCRLRAAEMVLEHAEKLWQFEDLEAQMEQLEETNIRASSPTV